MLRAAGFTRVVGHGWGVALADTAAAAVADTVLWRRTDNVDQAMETCPGAVPMAAIRSGISSAYVCNDYEVRHSPASLPRTSPHHPTAAPSAIGFVSREGPCGW